MTSCLEIKTASKHMDDHFLSEIRTIILNHINDPELNGELIGKQLGISRMHLHRKIKASINEPISSFIREIRLEQAYEMLKVSDLSISEIAYQNGFNSPGHFSKVFKKRFDATPSEVVNAFKKKF